MNHSLHVALSEIVTNPRDDLQTTEINAFVSRVVRKEAKNETVRKT